MDKTILPNDEIAPVAMEAWEQHVKDFKHSTTYDAPLNAGPHARVMFRRGVEWERNRRWKIDQEKATIQSERAPERANGLSDTDKAQMNRFMQYGGKPADESEAAAHYLGCSDLVYFNPESSFSDGCVAIAKAFLDGAYWADCKRIVQAKSDALRPVLTLVREWRRRFANAVRGGNVGDRGQMWLDNLDTVLQQDVDGRCEYVDCYEAGPHESHTVSGTAETLEDLRGAAPDATGGMSSEDFIAKQRSEEW